jgi:hypothetical protein
VIAVTEQRPPGDPTDPTAALDVQTVVVAERGRWAVDVVVVFADGVVRHRIDTFATRARAELSARLIKRAAEREWRRAR